jgi:hypothetical protein
MSVQKQTAIEKHPIIFQERVPAQLLALGLMLEGAEARPNYVISIFDAALRDADKVLLGVYQRGKMEDLEQGPAQGLVHDGVAKSQEYRKLEQAGADPARVVSDAIDQALFLGVALAYRYFASGGAR